jgi:glycerol uptake facilitator-like aquaporin
MLSVSLLIMDSADEESPLSLFPSFAYYHLEASIMGQFSLAAIFCSEFLGMTLTIFLGEGLLANELLPSTKGHGMGYLAVSIGFGLAFGISIVAFGWISAHLNPAMFFFLAIIGKLKYGWKEWIIGSLADILGAFVGACLVALFYAPHFGWSIPLPPDDNALATLVHGPAAISINAGRLASAFGEASKKPEDVTLKQELQNLLKGNKKTEYDESQRQALLEKMEVRHRKRHNMIVGPNVSLHSMDEPLLAFTTKGELTKRHSFNVADLLHEQDEKLPIDDNSKILRRSHSVQVAGLLHTHDEEKKQDATGIKFVADEEEPLPTNEEVTPKSNDYLVSSKQYEGKQAAYNAAIQADAHAKLSIFATRPAIYNRPYNFIQEAISTAILTFGAEMIHLRTEAQLEQDPGSGTITASQDPMMTALWISLFVTLLVLAIGGPTGLAANPARDFGPRLAHAILPIPNKGSSEWHYGLVVPLLAPFLGGALGAGVFLGVQKLYETGGTIYH